MSLSRRRFLAALASVAALPSVARSRVLGGGGRPAVLGFFSDDGAARRIGQAYLDSTPAEADARTLRALVAPPDVDPEQWWGTVTLRALRRHVRARVRVDFETEDGTEVLDGWVLAVTEARLAALVALTPG